MIRKKTVKVEPLDLEEEKLQMLIGTMIDMPLQKKMMDVAIVSEHSMLKYLDHKELTRS